MWEEFRNDIFAWPWTVINNIIFANFLYNSLRRPTRNVTTGTMTVTITPEESERTVSEERGAAKMAAETSMHNLELECAYPPPTFVNEKTTILSEKAEQERTSSKGHSTTEKVNYPWE